MKAAFENIEIIKGSQSFVAYSFSAPAFDFKWHYHPEFELTLITDGFGKRLIGDSHENFSTGDLVLVGSGLPHTWSTEWSKNKTVSAVVIQFSAAFINNFIQFEECMDIRKLLENASRGLFFKNDTSNGIEKLIRKLPNKVGLKRMTSLLEILQKLVSSNQTILSSEFYTANRNKENEKRINKICGHLQEKFSEQIALDDAAAMVHLSKSAFCKFFKRMMKINFSDYLNDIRIANACSQLSETDKTIREIAMDTGFESLTYFNRIFLRKKGKTPTAFRKNLFALKNLAYINSTA